jgi:hypothetical protein
VHHLLWLSSSRIGALQGSDLTLHEFTITTNDPDHSFESFLFLGFGSTVKLSSTNLAFLQSICCELWNQELYDQLFDSIESHLTCDNVFDRMKFLIETNHSYESEVVFCSSHLFELDSSRLCQLPYNVFCSIISHESLQLRDEDSLYELINNQFCVDSRYATLFESVRFEYLSTQSMLSFIGLINTSFTVLTFPIWEALNHRLSLSVSPTLQNDRIHEKFNSICCSFVEGSPLNSIISYLTRKYGGHICDYGIVSITASSVGSLQNWPLRTVALV